MSESLVNRESRRKGPFGLRHPSTSCGHEYTWFFLSKLTAKVRWSLCFRGSAPLRVRGSNLIKPCARHTRKGEAHNQQHIWPIILMHFQTGSSSQEKLGPKLPCFVFQGSPFPGPFGAGSQEAQRVSLATALRPAFPACCVEL